MVRLNIFKKKSVDSWREPNVLKRRLKDEPYVTPYVSPPPMPSAAPPAVPEPVPTFVDDFGDAKIDISATYSPRVPSMSPPGYISREPSTSTPPYERPTIPIALAPSRRPPAPPIAVATEHPPPMTSMPVPSAPIRDSQPPAPGDLPQERAPGQKITPEELRSLREMIRQRYQLDVQIWGERFLRERDRDVTEVKIRKADALMNKIRRTVIAWNDPQYFSPYTGDYEAFQEIARRIHSPGKRDWVNEPPWMATSDAGRDRRLY